MRSLSAPMHFPIQSYLEFTWCTWMHHLCPSNSDTDSRQKQRAHKWNLLTLETVSRLLLLQYDYFGTKLSLIDLWDLLTKQKISSHLALGGCWFQTLAVTLLFLLFILEPLGGGRLFRRDILGSTRKFSHLRNQLQINVWVEKLNHLSFIY